VTDVVVALFGKGDLRPGRLLAFAIVFVFCYLLVDRLWRPLNWSLGWLLLPLGQKALYAYSMHVVFVAVAGVLGLALPPLVLTDRMAKTLATLIQLGLVGLTWLLIRWGVFLPRRRNWPLWISVPAVAAAACLLVLPLDPTPTLAGWTAPAALPTPAADPRVARAFGTPVPRDGGTAWGPTPQPLVRRTPRAEDAPAPQARPVPAPVTIYVGPLRGTLNKQVLYSPALDAELPYFIYLPPDYDTAARRYPTLYMLHGASASYEEWLAYGFVDAVDQMIVAHEIQPLIVVLPQGDFGYWVNQVDDGPRWGDYVAEDLVREINTLYRAAPRALRRGVGGLSMGGHGALQLAFHHPDAFGVVGAHSPSLREDDGVIPVLGHGEEWEQRDPIALASTASGIEGLKIYIDIGTADAYFPRAELLRDTLRTRGLDPQWRAQDGREHGDWVDYVQDYLRFYDYALNPR
jgi:S-formylglutathione hydrolase FrmB